MTWRLLVSATALIVGCLPAPADCPEPKAPPSPARTTPRQEATELDQVTVPPRPDWADKYAHLNEGDMRFFDIEGLMDRYGLSRAQAIEVQNHYRDLSRIGEGTKDDWFRRAVAKADEGQFEDRRDLKTLAEAPFIVAFDLDETLYDQYYPPEIGEGCHDVAIPAPDGPRYLDMAPGWDEVIRRIRALGGAVVLFSANTDQRTLDNLRAVELDGRPLTDHPDISAVLTNSHLVLQTKERGQPVVEPSKDLRVFDETLKRVIIVDDNPTRLFQFDRVRVTPGLDAERYCRAKPQSMERRLMEATLAEVIDEIEEAAAYREKAGVTFAVAYLPYTMAGRLVVDGLVAAGMERSDALAWVREHPEAVD